MKRPVRPHKPHRRTGQRNVIVENLDLTGSVDEVLELLWGSRGKGYQVEHHSYLEDCFSLVHITDETVADFKAREAVYEKALAVFERDNKKYRIISLKRQLARLEKGG